MPLVMQVAYFHRKYVTYKTARHGWTQKVFFVNDREWAPPTETD